MKAMKHIKTGESGDGIKIIKNIKTGSVINLKQLSGLYNDSISSAEDLYNVLFGDPNGYKESDIEIIKTYARIQIEKRTNEIIEIITDHESGMPNEFIINRIKDLPITLD